MPAANLFADDLANADDIFRKPSRHKNDRKTQQLCRQVQRAISLALAGECGDPLLQSLVVESVNPSPDASRLSVAIYLPAAAQQGASWRNEMTSPDRCTDVGKVEETFEMNLRLAADLLGRLESVRPMLRREVAAAITRKRAPELAFQIVGPEVTP